MDRPPDSRTPVPPPKRENSEPVPFADTPSGAGLRSCGDVSGPESAAPGPAMSDRRTAEKQRVVSALALSVLVLALLGQFYFKNLHDILDGFVFFTVAILMLVALVPKPEAGSRPTSHLSAWIGRWTSRARTQPVRAALLITSLLLCYTGVRALESPAVPESYWPVFGVWVGSWSCFALACARKPHPQIGQWWQQYRLEVLVVAVLTAGALILRLTALGQVPNVVSGDEGRIGLLGISAAQGRLADMFATVYGHSTLYLLVIGLAMKLFGAGPTGLRMTSALAGAMTVPALYVLARHMFGVRVGLIAAALLTVSHLHLHFSRIIVAGGIQDALFATIAFYLFLTGLERRSTMRLVLSALTIGVHIYIYMGSRLIILFLPVYVLALLITNPRLVRENLGNLAAFAGMLIVVSAPMAVWAITHPADFNARANQVGIIQSGWLVSEAQKLGQAKLHILANQLLQAFLTVNYYQATGFYNSPLPMLDFLGGAFFMLGIGYSLLHVTDPRHLLLNGWFWSGVVVGGALVVLPAISAYRILIIFPAVCIFVALGLEKLLQVGLRDDAPGRLLKWGLTVAFIAVIGMINIRAYFVSYANSCLYEDWGTRFASYMGAELGQAGPEYQAFLFGYPRIWYGIHPSVDFLSGGIPITDIKDPLVGFPEFVDRSRKAIFFSTPDREQELMSVTESLPGGEMYQILDCRSPMLFVYKWAPAPSG
jgi:4-amino-4-deoxy-L-arabinose transferase-like glycosyltransferase